LREASRPCLDGAGALGSGLLLELEVGAQPGERPLDLLERVPALIELFALLSEALLRAFDLGRAVLEVALPGRERGLAVGLVLTRRRRF
jgi:hypothetical protein